MDAVTKASDPSGLVFGVIDQIPVARQDQLRQICQPAKLRYVQINPVDSRGVCWARSLAFSLYQDESFLLQIDSHMLFEPDWDQQLKAQWAALNRISNKPILSTYPYGFEFNQGQARVNITVSPSTTLVLRPQPDALLNDKSATLRFQAEHVFTREPVRGCHVAAGFIFTAGRFIEEIPYDPHLYFHGEEQNLAIRAFTHGWDIFHPPHIPLFHLYKRPNAEHNSHHWHPDWEKQRDFKFSQLNALAETRLMDLLYQQRDLGRYSLGTVRTLNDFAQLSGIHYALKKIIQPYQNESYFGTDEANIWDPNPS